MIDVTRVSTNGQAATIQYERNGRLHRAIVPAAAIRDGQVSEAVLSAAVDLPGFDLSELGDELVIKTADLENELRSAGLWTTEDLLKNPRLLMGIIQRLYGADVAAIQNAAYTAQYGGK